MRKHLYVDNTDLATFGVYCSGQGTFGAPEKEVTTYTVPGRDGLVLGVNERMENIRVVYPCFIYTNFAENMKNLRSFLLSRSGYVKINDDYDTDHFRMGFFEAGIDPNVTEKNNAGSFNLVFNCQPQRWLNSGAEKITGTGVYHFINPTLFDAKPLFRIVPRHSIGSVLAGFSNGTYNTPGYRYWELREVDVPADVTYIDFDSETMSAYFGDTNVSQYISIDYSEYGKPNVARIGDFPLLPPGDTRFSVGGSSSNWELTPRYWEA